MSKALVCSGLQGYVGRSGRGATEKSHVNYLSGLHPLQIIESAIKTDAKKMSQNIAVYLKVFWHMWTCVDDFVDFKSRFFTRNLELIVASVLGRGLSLQLNLRLCPPLWSCLPIKKTTTSTLLLS